MAAQRKGMLRWKGVTVFLLACLFTGVVGDTPDGVVYTDLQKTVLKGNTTVLKCEFYGDPIAVYWKKEDDPDQGTNLITWVEGNIPSGSCLTENACDLGDHYSLIIRNARISDQGRYTCRVSNYLGILIQNYTDVKIYARPEEPFPVIDKCVDKESSTMNSTQPCNIQPNTSTVSVTCTVINYYPALDLFFLHGSRQISDAITMEWTNDDETKNKSISIKASASETPYLCVASRIPGSHGQRAATILVKPLRPTKTTITIPPGSPISSSSNGVTMDMSNDKKAAKIAVPIVVIVVFIVGIGLVMIFVFHRRKLQLAITQQQHSLDQTTAATERNDTEERVPLLLKAKIDGDISFYELWSLAYETPEDDKMRLHQVLIKLNISNAKQGLTTAKIYDLLCEWKEQNEIAELAELLTEALESADLESRWMQLCEQRKRTDSKVSQETLEQIILGIGNPDRIQQFLGKLIPNRPAIIEGGGKDIFEEATRVMREWIPFEENPFASLSLALERSGCSPLDRIFFGGMISFFELWSLSNYLQDFDMERKRSLFEELGLIIKDGLTREELYDHLCSWKDRNKTISQGKRLRDALDRANLRKRWKDIKDLRRGDKTEVSQHTLEHILWHIKDPKKIGQFMQRLTLNDPGMQLDVKRGLREAIKEAVIRLQIWAKKISNENPFVLLSLVLEKTGCCPIDRTFFKAPDALTQEIDEYKIQSLTDSLTRRHIKMLSVNLSISKTEATMTKENKETMFDTELMISDWIAKEECSNYEKRWKLKKAVDSIGRQDLKDFFREMEPVKRIGVKYEESASRSQRHEVNFQFSDFIKDAFQWIVPYLSSSQLKDLFGGKDDPKNALRSYAEQQMGKKSKQDWRKKIRQNLKSRGLEELKQNVYLCELLDVTFRLLLDDVYPLAKALGISDEKLMEYRVDYAPDHLTKGTTAALIKFSETNKSDRVKVCQALYDSGCVDVALLLEYGKCRTSSSEGPVAIERIIGDIESFQRPLISRILGEDAKKLPDQRVIDLPMGTSLLDKRSTDVNKGQPWDGFTESRSPDTKGESNKMDKAIGKADKSAIARKLALILGIKMTQQSSAQDISTRQVIETWGKKTSLGKDDRRKLSDDLMRAGFKDFAFEVMTGSVPSKKSKLPWKKSKQQMVGKQGQLAEIDDKAEQASDDNEEQDNKDNVEPAIKNSVDRYIEDNDLQQAIKDNGGRVITEKSSDSSRANSSVQANLDSDDSGTSGSDDLEIKDAGNQGITNSGDCAIKEHSDPPIRNNNDSDHTASGNQAIDDSKNPAIKDKRDEVIKRSDAPPTDSVVRASSSDDPATKGSYDSHIKVAGNQTSSDSGEQAIKISSDSPSETRMKETTQAASNVQASTSTENGDTLIKDGDNQTTNGGD